MIFERDSDVFAQMFSAKKIGGGEGKSDRNPIQLRQINVTAFRDLLSILLPL